MSIRIKTKRGLCILAAAMLAVSAAGCGKRDDKPDEKQTAAVNAASIAEPENAVTELESGSDSAIDSSAADTDESKDGGKKPDKSDSSSKSDSEAEPEPEPLPEIPPDVRKDRPYLGASANDDFSDACFIGASQTVGLSVFGNKVEPDFFAYAGLNVKSVFDKKFISVEDEDELQAVVDVIGKKEYKRVYLCFGLNELGGWIDFSQFYDGYCELIREIRRVQPTAHIYVESVLPVNIYALETNVLFTNENIDNFNREYIRPIANASGATYLNVNTLFKCTNGYLPREAATDGIHMTAAYCQEWLDMLAYYTPPGGPRADRPLPTDDGEPDGPSLGDLPPQIIPPDLPEVIIPDDSSEPEEDPEPDWGYDPDGDWYGDDGWYGDDYWDDEYYW